MIDRETSFRLDMLRFPLIVGVVLIHARHSTTGFSFGDVGVAELDRFAKFVVAILSWGIARVSVPLFFLMSGYLYFKDFAFSLSGYLAKVRSRCRTLLVPLLFWNLLTLFVFYVGENLSMTQVYFTGRNTPVDDLGLMGFLDEIFGITGYPRAYQFWFIRDLLVLVLLSPLIYGLHKLRGIGKFVPHIFLAAFFGLWASENWPIHIPAIEALFFFYAGSTLAIAGKGFFCMDKLGHKIIVIYFVVLIMDALTKDLFFSLYLHKIGILIGILAAMQATKIIAHKEKVRDFLVWAGGTSFFVYAMHEPLLKILRKVSYKIFSPNSSSEFLSLYLAMPVVTILVTVVVYCVLVRVAPNFTRIITGDRSRLAENRRVS